MSYIAFDDAAGVESPDSDEMGLRTLDESEWACRPSTALNSRRYKPLETEYEYDGYGDEEGEGY